MLTGTFPPAMLLSDWSFVSDALMQEMKGHPGFLSDSASPAFEGFLALYLPFPHATAPPSVQQVGK